MADNALNTNQNSAGEQPANTPDNADVRMDLDDLTTMIPQGGSTSSLLAAADATKQKAEGKPEEPARAELDLS